MQSTQIKEIVTVIMGSRQPLVVQHAVGRSWTKRIRKMRSCQLRRVESSQQHGESKLRSGGFLVKFSEVETLMSLMHLGIPATLLYRNKPAINYAA